MVQKAQSKIRFQQRRMYRKIFSKRSVGEIRGDSNRKVLSDTAYAALHASGNEPQKILADEDSSDESENINDSNGEKEKRFEKINS